MTRNVRRLERPGADLLANLLDDVACSRGGQASLAVITRRAVEVDEHRHACVGPRSQVVLHRRTSIRGEVHAPLLGTFSCNDESIARAGEIGAVERESFGDAAAGAHEEVHQRAIALFEQGFAGQRRQKPQQLVRIDWFGEPLLELGQRDAV